MCVSVVNYDTAEINYKSKTTRISGYFEGGSWKEILTSSSLYYFGKIGVNYQRGYGICENTELGTQFGGEIGGEKEKDGTPYTIFGSYFLRYIKIGQKAEDHYISFKFALGGGFFNRNYSFIIFPLAYIDMMLGFPLENEKLTIYGGVGIFSAPRLGLNFHFNKFSIFFQMSSFTRDYFSFKLGAGCKF